MKPTLTLGTLPFSVAVCELDERCVKVARTLCDDFVSVAEPLLVNSLIELWRPFTIVAEGTASLRWVALLI
jgi:threonine dehydratase